MKKIILLAIATLFATVSFAQTSTAVLVHNDSLQVFYGLNALVDAHTAAVAGDVITLSSGTFTGLTITKPITLRGAGMKADTNGVTQPTVIVTEVVLNIDTTISEHIILEGIYFNTNIKYINIANPHIIRCMMNSVEGQGVNPRMLNAIFVNCILGEYVDWGYRATNTSFYNSVIGDIGVSQSTFYNCICGYPGGGETSQITGQNSIFF